MESYHKEAFISRKLHFQKSSVVAVVHCDVSDNPHCAGMWCRKVGTLLHEIVIEEKQLCAANIFRYHNSALYINDCNPFHPMW
jgi:hypothetical protein